MCCKKTSGIIALMFLLLAVSAQESLSLSDAIQIGLQNNYQIRVASKEVVMATRNNNLGNAGFYPNLNLVVGESNIFNVVDDPITFRNFNNRIVGLEGSLELNWVLFKGFRVYITKSKLGLLQDFSAGTEAIVVENTIQAIMLAYFRALVEQEKLKVVKEVIKLSRDRYAHEQLKKEFGASGSFEQLQFKTAFLSDSTSYLLQEILLKGAITELKLLMAADENQTYHLVDTLANATKRIDWDDLRNEMLSNNSTLRNQYINFEIYQNEIALQKANLYPTISARGGITQSFSTFKNLDEDVLPIIESFSLQPSRNYYAIFSLSFNLFNGGNYIRAIKNSKIQAQIAQLNLEEAKTNLLGRLRLQFDQFQAQKNIVTVSELNVESATINLELAESKFKNGTLNSLDYRNIQLQYLNTSLRRLEAIYSAKQTEIELLRLTGSILEVH